MVPMEPAYLLGTGGAIGAVLRYLVADFVVQQQGKMKFPLSTLVVNIIGSFVLGVIILGNFSKAVTLFFGVGVCGAFTTFSSFSVQTVRLWETGMRGYAVVNAVGNFVLSVAAAGLAWLLIG